MVLRMKMSGRYAIASPASRLSRPGAGACVLLALLVVSALLVPPLWLLAAAGPFLVLIAVHGAPSPVLIRLSCIAPMGRSPRGPPLPA